jgi:hypothetical protein
LQQLLRVEILAAAAAAAVASLHVMMQEVGWGEPPAVTAGNPQVHHSDTSFMQQVVTLVNARSR